MHENATALGRNKSVLGLEQAMLGETTRARDVAATAADTAAKRMGDNNKQVLLPRWKMASGRMLASGRKLAESCYIPTSGSYVVTENCTQATTVTLTGTLVVNGSRAHNDFVAVDRGHNGRHFTVGNNDVLHLSYLMLKKFCRVLSKMCSAGFRQQFGAYLQFSNYFVDNKSIVIKFFMHCSVVRMPLPAR